MAQKTIRELEEKIYVDPTDLVMVSDGSGPHPDQAYKATVEALGSSFLDSPGLYAKFASIRVQNDPLPAVGTLQSSGLVMELSHAQDYDNLEKRGVIKIQDGSYYEVVKKLSASQKQIEVDRVSSYAPYTNFSYAGPNLVTSSFYGDILSYDNPVRFVTTVPVYATELYVSNIYATEGEYEIRFEDPVEIESINVGVDIPKVAGQLGAQIVECDTFSCEDTFSAKKISYFEGAIEHVALTMSDDGDVSFPNLTCFGGKSLSFQVACSGPGIINVPWPDIGGYQSIIQGGIGREPLENNRFLITSPGLYAATVSVEFDTMPAHMAPNFSSLWVEMIWSGTVIAQEKMIFKDQTGGGFKPQFCLSCMFFVDSPEYFRIRVQNWLYEIAGQNYFSAPDKGSRLGIYQVTASGEA